MKVTKSPSGILSSGGDVIASDLTVDGTTVTVDETNNRLGVNTDAPLGTIGVDGDLYFQPTAISTSHVYTAGSLDVRATANIKIGTDGADSIKIGRTNTTAAKVHLRSGGESDLVVSNSKVGIGTDAPDHTLSVAGDIDLTGGLSFDGGTAVTSIDTDLSSVSGSDDTLASAKSIKAYVDSVATGDITGVTAGDGLTGGGTSGGVSLAVGAGTGIDVAADAISVDVSDFMTNGSNNRIVTATGTDAMNAESALTFDGNTLTIDDTVTATDAGTYTALDLNFTKTGASTSDNTMIGLDLTMTNTEATNGTNSMIGAKIDTTCQHAANAGTVLVKGAQITATGATPGTETARGLEIISTGADFNQGIYMKIDDGGPDLKMVSSADINDACTIAVGAAGATTITTTDNSAANADLVFSVDGSFDVTATSASFSSDLTVTGGDLTLGTSADANNATISAATESGTDVAGKSLTIGGGLGTGNAASGDVIVTLGIPGSSGTSAHSATTVQKHTAAGTSTFYGGTAALTNDTGVGDIVFFGTEDGTDSLAAGRLMVMNSSGVWKYADADAVATTKGLLGIALGSAVTDGFLLRGFFKLNSYIEGTFAKGAECYVSEAPGEIDFNPPSASGDTLRIVGFGTDTDGVIYFSPSPDYIEL